MLVGLSIASLLISLISLLISLYVTIRFMARELSTHTIQQVPIEIPGFGTGSVAPPDPYEDFESAMRENEAKEFDRKLSKIAP